MTLLSAFVVTCIKLIVMPCLVSLRLFWPPAWPDPSGFFSLTYIDSQANYNKAPLVLDKLQMNTIQQKTNLSEYPEVQLK